MRQTFKSTLLALDAAGVFPVDADTTKKKSLLNQGIEAAILSGRWNGTECPLNIRPNASGEVTVPRNFETIKGAKVNGFVRDMASPWYSYLQGSSDALQQWTSALIDRGDGYPTFAQPTALIANAAGILVRQSTPAKLRVVSTGAPVTGSLSYVEVHGTDSGGNEVWTGAQRGTQLTFGVAKTVPYFSIIREVIKPPTPQICYLYACYDDSTEEAIGIYEPGETVPSYRRYFLPELAGMTSDQLSISTVDSLCQRRFVALVADNDLVPISNFRALKNLVLSIYWEDEGDESRSKDHLDTAISYLNSELTLLRPPSELGAVRVNATACGALNMKAMR